MPRQGRASAGFFTATSLWLFGMVGLGLAYHFLRGPPPQPPGQPWWALEMVSGWLGLLLPFAAFAGGLRVHRTVGPHGVLGRALALAALGYALLAYAAPLARYRAEMPAGAAAEASASFGPATPGGLKARRAYVQEHPPERYGFSVEEPLARPPNWFTYLLYQPAFLAAFTLLSALLGWVGGHLTSPLPPAPRASARGLLGVASSVAFMAAVVAAGDWVRLIPANSALLAAWGPLLVPGSELAVLAALLRYRLGPLRSLTRRAES